MNQTVMSVNTLQILDPLQNCICIVAPNKGLHLCVPPPFSSPTSHAPVQTSSQTELENWITAIHSACATALARLHHREDTVRLLRTEIRKLEQKIDMDEKMKKMGDMQLSTVTDTKKRKTILEQVRRRLLACSMT